MKCRGSQDHADPFTDSISLTVKVVSRKDEVFGPNNLPSRQSSPQSSCAFHENRGWVDFPHIGPRMSQIKEISESS